MLSQKIRSAYCCRTRTLFVSRPAFAQQVTKSGDSKDVSEVDPLELRRKEREERLSMIDTESDPLFRKLRLNMNAKDLIPIPDDSVLGAEDFDADEYIQQWEDKKEKEEKEKEERAKARRRVLAEERKKRKKPHLALVDDKRLYPFIPMPEPEERMPFQDFMPEDTFRYHYEKEYVSVVMRLNQLLNSLNGAYDDFNLVDLAKGDHPQLADLASRVANHELFFNHLGWSFNKFPQGRLADLFTNQFGGFRNFKQAMALQGEGWVYLAIDSKFILHIVTSDGNASPMRLDMTPVLLLDLHEHAYKMDYPDKQTYVERYFYYIDWEYVTELLVRTT